MRISSPPYLVDLNTTREVRQASETAAPPAPKAVSKRAPNSTDHVAISSQSREIDRLKQELAALPDVRLDRVALAKQQLQQGAYRVDPKLLAQKMLESTGKA